MDEGEGEEEGEGEGGSEECSPHLALSICQRVVFTSCHITLRHITSVQTLHCGWISSEAFSMDRGPIGSLDSRHLSPIFSSFCIRLSPVSQASFFHYFLLECLHILCK